MAQIPSTKARWLPSSLAFSFCRGRGLVARGALEMEDVCEGVVWLGDDLWIGFLFGANLNRSRSLTLLPE